MKLLRAFLAVMLLALTPAAHAQSFPPLSGRVVDAANILSPQQKQQLTALSDQVQKASTRQLVVATVPTLQGYPIEDYGYRLGRAWGIGQKDANNGIILLVAPNDRKVRIEVGYGLEPIMTDALSSVIVNQTILPKFRAGDMGGGVVAGAQAIGEQLKLPLEAAEVRAKKVTDDAASRGNSSDSGPIVIFWLIVLVFIILPMIVGRARGKSFLGGVGPVVLWGPGMSGGWGNSGGSSWGGGGDGGGGGFSGGGGSFGGGGASGGW